VSTNATPAGWDFQQAQALARGAWHADVEAPPPAARVVPPSPRRLIKKPQAGARTNKKRTSARIAPHDEVTAPTVGAVGTSDLTSRGLEAHGRWVSLYRKPEESFGLDVKVGKDGIARVHNVDRGSPAAVALGRGELDIGDRIEFINGTQVTPGVEVTALMPEEATTLRLGIVSAAAKAVLAAAAQRRLQWSPSASPDLTPDGGSLQSPQSRGRRLPGRQMAGVQYGNLRHPTGTIAIDGPSGKCEWCDFRSRAQLMERHIPRTPPRGWTDARWNEFTRKLLTAVRGYYTWNRVMLVSFLLWIADAVFCFRFSSDAFEAACGETNRTALEEAGVGARVGSLWLGPCTHTFMIILYVQLLFIWALPYCFVNRLNRRVDKHTLGPLCIEFGLTLRVWTEKIEGIESVTYVVHPSCRTEAE
jgi:hypothetical protein